MARQPKLSGYRLFYERIEVELPKVTPVKKTPGPKPRQIRQPKNILENLEETKEQ